jgi:hypothetical protein
MTDSEMRKVSALTVFFESSSVLCLTKCISADPRLRIIKINAKTTRVLMIMNKMLLAEMRNYIVELGIANLLLDSENSKP